MLLGTEVGLNPGDIVLDGNLAPLQKWRTAAPTFLPMYCGQIAGWIKMRLCMEVSLGHGYMVLDGDPAPPP